ncbi:MAG TPA: hypothetical protein VHT73_11300 [Thermodesulfobacteriota bacterium]|nr:hypothetical protein [Thermodesulfobacteriota bacterium]
MKKDKSSISKASSYKEIGEFWYTMTSPGIGNRPSPRDRDVPPISSCITCIIFFQ